MTEAPPKPKRKQHPEREGRVSKTKQKGSPVVGRQASTLFGQPNAPKPGITRDQALLRNKSAQLADKLSFDILEEVDKAVTAAKTANQSAEAISIMTTNVFNLMKYAIEREFGKAAETLDIKSTDGSMSPQASHADAVLEALKRKHDPNA